LRQQQRSHDNFERSSDAYSDALRTASNGVCSHSPLYPQGRSKAPLGFEPSRPKRPGGGASEGEFQPSRFPVESQWNAAEWNGAYASKLLPSVGGLPEWKRALATPTKPRKGMSMPHESYHEQRERISARFKQIYDSHPSRVAEIAKENGLNTDPIVALKRKQQEERSELLERHRVNRAQLRQRQGVEADRYTPTGVAVLARGISRRCTKSRKKN
jgi:hypothetical protein